MNLPYNLVADLRGDAEDLLNHFLDVPFDGELFDMRKTEVANMYKAALGAASARMNPVMLAITQSYSI